MTRSARLLPLLTLLACRAPQVQAPTDAPVTTVEAALQPGGAPPQVRVYDLDGRPTADVQVSWDERMVEARAAGWSTALSGRQAEDGDRAYTELVLAPLEVGTLRLNDQGGAAALAGGLHIQLAPEAIVDEDGRDVAGEVTVHVALLDDERELVAAPGPMLLAQDGGDVRLGIYSAFELGLREGEDPAWLDGLATISIPVPASAAPERSSLALYAYDEDAGRWRAAGPVAVVDGRFVADVEHAGWFAVGALVLEAPMVGDACIEGALVTSDAPDAPGLPGLEISVVARLSAGHFVLERVSTDDHGGFHLDVPTRSLVKLSLLDPGYQWSTGLIRARSSATAPCIQLGAIVPVDIDLDDDGYASFSSGGPDCDDGDDAINPSATDTPYDGIDSDCDEGDDFDVDGDGARADGYDTDEDGDIDGDDGGDCDDADADRFDLNPEVCGDGIDNDCDDRSDADDPDATDAVDWYEDEDGDGYGALDSVPERDCTLRGAGWSRLATDCDDGDSAIHPDQQETECSDGVDNNCDGIVDLDSDLDDDGYGACSGDCDDEDGETHEGAAERCDAKDNDCDGAVDEDTVYTWYRDRDGDGHGSARRVVRDVCDPPGGFVARDDDCDDRPGARGRATFPGAAPLDSSTACMKDRDEDDFGDDAAVSPVSAGSDCDDEHSKVNPDRFERCDPEDKDEDCDGAADDEDTGWDEDPLGVDTGDAAETGVIEEDDGAPVRFLWLRDDDGDGFGDGDDWVYGCEPPDGYVEDGGELDCDDTRSEVSPDAVEVCNATDDDCDDDLDEDAVDAATWYADGDEDGYGDPALSLEDCEAPAGYVGNGTDCEDGDDDVYPGAKESCNEEDDDCDGSTDEGLRTFTWYWDEDGDRYGLSDSTVSDCGAPDGYATVGGDCDDDDRGRSPDALETCDDIDDDCDGVADDDPIDAAAWYPDRDSDGFGDLDATPTLACDAPIGYVESDEDCDDTDGWVHPAADDDQCDGLDDDCDGMADDETWRVGADGAGYDFATLQDAIDAATAGDTVCVTAGTYTGTTTWEGKDLTIISQDGADATVLDGEGDGPVVTMRDLSEESALEGFTVTGGVASDGGGLYLDTVSATLSELIVSANHASNDGGGLYLMRSDATISGSTIEFNTAIDGGGLFLYGADASLLDLIVVSNASSSWGGGLYAFSSSASVSKSLVMDNSAFLGGGILMRWSTMELNGLTVVGNDASVGGGIAIGANKPVLTNTLISHNNTTGDGAAVYESYASSTLTYTNLFANTSDSGGDEVYGLTFTPGTDGNLSVDPEFVSFDLDADPSTWDLHLLSTSPLIDAGDPSLLDEDGSVSDIGALGPSTP